MGQHWYTKDAEPMHWITGANGNERDTTLRDAKKQTELGLRPSVTTILGVLDKPALNMWKQRQIIEAALTLPMAKDESLDDFIKRIPQDAFEGATEARDRGELIHGCIENLIKGTSEHYEDDVMQIAECAIEDIYKHTGQQVFGAECTVSDDAGFGGMIDLSNDIWVIDHKTKDITNKQWDLYTEGKDPKLHYPEHCMQLSAYSHALGGGHRLLNVFIDRMIPGRVILHEWDRSMYEGFEYILRYWQWSKQYWPLNKGADND